MSYPVLIYNSCCRFCSDIAHLLLHHFGEKEKLRIVPNDKRALKHHKDLTLEKIQKNVHLISNEEIFTNMAAVVEILAFKKRYKVFKYSYKVPILKHGMDFTYFLAKKFKTLYNKVRG